MRRLTRNSLSATFVCVALACVACNKPPTISLTANPTSITLGQLTNGQVTPVVLTATGTDSGSPWVDSSVTVEFQTDWGNFDPPSDDDATDNQDVQVSISGHQAIQNLYPDATAPKDGVAHVTAIYINTGGTKVTATVNINVQASAVAASLSFNCLSGNIGAFADQNTTMEIGCTAQAYDSGGHQVQGVQINFLAEAGAIDYDTEYDTYAYYPFNTGPGNVEGNQPLDVMPLSGEPSYVDVMGKTRNPRDGLVSMVAYAPSDATNTGALQGEPYVDVDDSGSFHAGDPYVDLNHNGQWDSSQTAVVWVQTKILWTGSLQTVSEDTAYDPTYNGNDVGDGVDLQYGATGTFVWYLLDENLNIIAANDPALDSVTWECNPEPNAEPLVTTTELNPDDSKRYGMLMDQYGNLTDPGDASSWGIDGTYSLTVRNESACESGATAVSFTCAGTVFRTLWLDAQGMSGDTISNEQTQVIMGTAEPDPPSCLDN